MQTRRAPAPAAPLAAPRRPRAAAAARAPARCASASALPLHVVIAGAPASGKGTQCELIVERYGLAHVSTGDLLRAEVAAGTAAGAAAQAFMERGDLVPDEVVATMVVRRLAQPDAQANGYPRSEGQARALEAAGIRPQLFLLLDVPDSVLVERVVGRRLDPVTGKIYHLKFAPPPAEAVPRLTVRSDDTEAKARNRLAVHARNVGAVRGLYEGLVAEVDGNRAKGEVFGDVCAAIDALQAKQQQQQQ